MLYLYVLLMVYNFLQFAFSKLKNILKEKFPHGLKNFKSSALSEHFTTKDHTYATNQKIAKSHRLALACNSAEKKIDFCKYVEHVIKLPLGKHLNKFLLNFSEEKEENNYSIGAHQLLWNENYEADLIADILSFASAVVLEIQERFPNRPLLNSMKMLDHVNWPSNKEELTNYGEEELNMLSEFYKKEINNINLCEEWF
ncbi:hypothetical protein C1646_677819 [Rhizophagus diaphanus]|nr:hypothetical protein C1646_677819 [Rhizophagus diaphanus] [Rhizophagus sp. MUCL 43196]